MGSVLALARTGNQKKGYPELNKNTATPDTTAFFATAGTEEKRYFLITCLCALCG